MTTRNKQKEKPNMKVSNSVKKVTKKTQMELMKKIQNVLLEADQLGVDIIVGNKYCPDSFVLKYGSKETTWRFERNQ